MLKFFAELLKLYVSFFKMGILTFGGGYAMLPMIEREVVEKHKWATMEEVMDYYAISQCTPGVIAVNIATFVGQRQKGVLGAIFATIGVVTPSVILISLIATLLRSVYDNEYVRAAFQGVGVAVCAILVQAVLKIGKSGIVDKFTLLVAFLSFLIAWLLGVSTIVIILVAGVCSVAYKVLKEKNHKNGGAE